jgi:hypothetical protein
MGDERAKSEASLAALRALLAAAPPEVQAFGAEDHTLLRYLVAHAHSAPKALAGLAATAKWRATLVEPGFSCAMCAARPGAHCFVSLGQDDEGAALIYGCPARASEGGEVEKTVLHCVNSLEKQWGAQGAAPQQWVWIVDFNGFGLTHAMQARLGISFVR